MKYYISDLHLFHENAIKFDHHPFKSVQGINSNLLKFVIIKKFMIQLDF